MARLRIVFMGTPDFSVMALRALIDAGHEIICIYTQPPRPAGRGHKPRPTPVHAAGDAAGIPVRTPATLKTADAQAEFVALGADVAVVAAYGLILPKPVLDAPRLGCVNIHASLLPRWRGAAPIQRALMAGDKESGITIMRMDEGLDTGDILTMEAVPIAPGMDGGMLHDALAELGARMIVSALEGLAAGTLTPRKQPEEGVTYAAKLTRDDGRIDWRQPADAVARQIRALNPFPGAWFAYGEERIRVLAAEIAVAPASATPCRVLDDRLTVACGHGAVRLTRVQRAGKGPMDTEAFLRGFRIVTGTVLPVPGGLHP